MLIADSGANPRHLAADLLAQAEHGSGKEILYYATTSKRSLPKLSVPSSALPGCGMPKNALPSQKTVASRLLAHLRDR